jgi:hypothetical protein
VPARHAEGATTSGLRRLGRLARGQPQLPPGRHPLGLPVRRARAHRPRHPAQRGRPPPGARPSGGGLAAARPPRRRGRGGQRRDLLPPGRPRPGGLRRRPGAGP